jgi:ribosomal protein S18 acetylase RimI-like enzyme
MHGIDIRRVTSDDEGVDLARLLWSVLWEPLGLPESVGRSFGLTEPWTELIAVRCDAVVGGLVANWLSGTEVEIRHLAVLPEYRRQSVGRRLVCELVRLADHEGTACIETYARNTSAGFFARLGFVPTGESLEDAHFGKYGIHFERMRLELAGSI